MYTILPLLNLIALYAFLSNIRPRWSLVQRLSRSSVLIGFFAVLLIEAFSLFKGITRTNLITAWSLLLLSLIWMIAKTYDKGTRYFDINRFRPQTAYGWWVFISVLSIIMLTAAVAVLTPPQTWDVLNYHMSRVAHWAQNKSVEHFATGIEIQNSIPPGAEYGLLHLYVLAQGDRYVHFLQWFAMVGSLLAVGEIARRLGANRKGVVLSVLLSASMPLGIVQASSAMSEYVLSLWILFAVIEVFNLRDDPHNPTTWIFLGLASGLAILTKPHAFAYLLPFAIYALVILLRSRSTRHLVAASFTALVLVGLINAPFIFRSIRTYGSPFAKNQVSLHANEEISARTLISNTLRNAALHAGTPSSYVNKGIYLVIDQIHRWMNLDLNEPSISSFGNFKVFKPITNEVTISNPLHAWLMLGVLIYAGIKRKLLSNPVKVLIFLALASYGLMSLIFRWQIFGGRFQLTFFNLMMPVMGLIIANVLSHRWLWVLSVVLPICAAPWLLSIQSRPLIATSESSSESILIADRESLYFANGRYLEQPYQEMTALIRESSCPSVGISLPGGAAEYPLWALLGAPASKYHIEWIVAGTPSDKYIDSQFKACALICDRCPGDWETYKSLTITYEDGPYRLYLSEE